jgi:hypothetical protein
MEITRCKTLWVAKNEKSNISKFFATKNILKELLGYMCIIHCHPLGFIGFRSVKTNPTRRWRRYIMWRKIKFRFPQGKYRFETYFFGGRLEERTKMNVRERI